MEKIKFEINKPVEMRLAYLEGKPVKSDYGFDGMQYMYSTTDGRVFFVATKAGQIIEQQLMKLNIEKGEPVEIGRFEFDMGRGRKQIQWIVKRVNPIGEQRDGTFAVENGAGTGARTPAPVVEPSVTATSNGNGNKPPVNGHAAAAGAPEHNMHQGWGQFLLSQTNAIIDVYAAALRYSARHEGLVKAEDVRSVLLSAFIHISRNGGAHVA